MSPRRISGAAAAYATLASMQSAFGTVLVIVCAVGVIVAIFLLARGGRTWADYRASGLIKDSEQPDPDRAGAQAAAQERATEIQELVQARNRRRGRRGQPPLDVEAQLAQLTDRLPEQGRPSREAQVAPTAVDPELRSEIRDLVMARNHRRRAAGLAPLDVEGEIERQILRLKDL